MTHNSVGFYLISNQMCFAQMFESRPIWSRNAVKANINLQPDKLKLLLPVVAYYMVSWEDTVCPVKNL